MYFKPISFLIALGLFCIEIVIATLLSSIPFIRGSIGDFLVVILLYYLVLAFRQVDPLRLAFMIFLFACIIEGLQYFQLAQLLGLEPRSILSIIIGTTFSWEDVLMYFLGCVTAFALQRLIFKKYWANNQSGSNTT